MGLQTLRAMANSLKQTKPGSMQSVTLHVVHGSGGSRFGDWEGHGRGSGRVYLPDGARGFGAGSPFPPPEIFFFR